MARYFQSRTKDPISQFVPLPLDLVAAQIGQKQQERDVVESQILNDLDLEGRFIHGTPDETRTRELQQNVDTRLEDIRNQFMEAGSDNTRDIQRQFNALKKERDELLKPTGQLGAFSASRDMFDEFVKNVEDSDLRSADKQAALNYAMSRFSPTGTQFGTEGTKLFEPLPLAKFKNIEETARDIMNDMSPQTIKQTTGWNFDPKTAIWSKGTYETTEMPAEFIEQVVLPSLESNREVTDYAQWMQMVGLVDDYRDPLRQAARATSFVGQRADSSADQDIKFTPKPYLDMYGFGSEPTDYAAGLITKDLVDVGDVDSDLDSSFNEVSTYFDSNGNINMTKLQGDIDYEAQLTEEVRTTGTGAAQATELAVAAIKRNQAQSALGVFNQYKDNYSALYESMKQAGRTDQEFMQTAINTDKSVAAVRHSMYWPKSQSSAQEAQKGFENDVLFDVEKSSTVIKLDEHGNPDGTVKKNDVFYKDDNTQQGNATFRVMPYRGQLVIQDVNGNQYVPHNDDMNDQVDAHLTFVEKVNKQYNNYSDSGFAPAISGFEEVIRVKDENDNLIIPSQSSGYPIVIKKDNQDGTFTPVRIWTDNYNTAFDYSSANNDRAFTDDELSNFSPITDDNGYILEDPVNLNNFNSEYSTRIFDAYNPTGKGE